MVTCDGRRYIIRSRRRPSRWQDGSLWMDGRSDGAGEGEKKIKEIRKHPPEHGSKATARRARWTSVILLILVQTFRSSQNWGWDRDEVDWSRSAASEEQSGVKKTKREGTTQCLRFFKHSTLLGFTFPSCSRAESSEQEKASPELKADGQTKRCAPLLAPFLLSSSALWPFPSARSSRSPRLGSGSPGSPKHELTHYSPK